MGGVAFLDDGPRVLSLYEGFFSGGARALHNAVVRSLQATTGQRHTVLSLTDRAVREATVQSARADAGYRRLTAAGVPIRMLRRITSDPLRPGQVASVGRAVAASDVVLTLKEQPLRALVQLPLLKVASHPVVTCLHRSDPEHSGAALDDLVSLVEQGVVTTAVCCAESTQAAYHAVTGIPLAQLPVIPNGVDLHRFRPIADDRVELRRELGVVGESPVVVLSARFDPMKDIGLFLRAAARYARLRPDVHLVMCGAGMSADNRQLTDQIVATLGSWDGAGRQVHLLGIRHDMPRLYNAADLVVLTSAYGEAAPLSLLEGMACGAVPVTTAVGDAALMVGDLRLVTGHEADGVALAWDAAYEQREEHAERILRHRQRLSDQRCFDAYSSLIVAQAARASLGLAV